MAELTRIALGEELTMDELVDRVGAVELTDVPAKAAPTLWVASVGYERHKDQGLFVRHLSDAGVERLIDVRELPISRRRGYSKSALANATAEAGIEYVHIKALGNPKPYRDLYKQGRVAEGRAAFEQHLMSERSDALRELVPMLEEKRSALMCVEHDPSTCHRTVILQALSRELSLQLEVAEVG